MPSNAGSGVSYRNWITLAGVALTTVSAVLFLFFFFLDLAGFHPNPYLGIATFLLLPGAFVVGLLLIPLGMWRTRRRAAQGKRVSTWPTLDFSHASVRRNAIVVLALSGINVAIIGMASLKSVEYVDSTGFCTGVCHTPMQPEALAHQRSVHASISCASCHIGPGPEGFARAKLGGVRRLNGVMAGSYSRPIPTPVHDLPSASGTCESCHRSTKYVGERTRDIRYYSDDETNTEQITQLTFKVGGGGWERGGPHGIHWHASPTTRVEYIAMDEKRETIPWVRVTDHRGQPREYVADGFSRDTAATASVRVMDCTDCHNRQGHAIAPTIDRAVDDALARDLLPRSLPFIRREAIAALTAAKTDDGTVDRQVADHLSAFYAQAKDQRATDAAIRQAIAATQQLRSHNVFPAMNVTWGTYPSQLGHTDAPGCFRCHDETKKTVTGLVLSQDCEGCHRMQ